MGDDPRSLQPVPQKQQLADLLKDYLNDYRLFTAALEELQGQLSKIESELSKSKSKPSKLMKVVSEKANTLKFKQYIEGSLPSPPQPNLAAGIDENIRLLSVLCSEMSKFVDRIEILQDTLKLKFKHSSEMQSELQQEEEEGGKHHGSTWEQAANDALLAAVTVDALKQDLVLIRKVAETVSILTPSAELSSYVLILNVHPHFSTSLLEELLSWRR
ncbi:hypothetical protein Ndes2526B_g06255 [Nannochloris sp. 'desiccata']|nr:hypothetical protein NADE_006136 [Chlorella desiccata (nom. nud.)]